MSTESTPGTAAIPDPEPPTAPAHAPEQVETVLASVPDHEEQAEVRTPAAHDAAGAPAVAPPGHDATDVADGVSTEAAVDEAAALDSQSAPVAEAALSSSEVEPRPAAGEAGQVTSAALEQASAPAVDGPVVEQPTAEIGPVADQAVPAGPGAEALAADEPAPEVVAQASPESVPAPAAAGPRPSPAALAGLTRPAPPRPVAAAAPAATPSAPAPAPDPDAPPRPTDSETFGRVDDDGTVHVRLSDGSEQPVGQWAAGTPTEGLAFFVRKYDDLSVEVDLATRRLVEGKATPEQASAVVKRARESLASPSMVGDLGSLTARVDALDTIVTQKKAAAAEVRAAAKAAALAAREAIVTEAEVLAESTQWKATGERFKTLLDEWKAAPRADRTSEQTLWKRFSHARSQFDKHRRQYFARLDSERGEAKQVKEALVAEAESLQSSTDWGATAGAYRDLMSRWKASGRAGKADEEALWARFRAAQDAFFAARNAALGQRDAGFAENLAAKEALLAEAEAIDTADLRGAKAALRSIQDRWEKVGHVPRGDKERIEGRLRKVEDAVRRGEQDQWTRSNPETRARANATVEQFGSSLDKLEKQHAAAVTAGDTRTAADLEARIATTRALLDAAERAAGEFSG